MTDKNGKKVVMMGGRRGLGVIALLIGTGLVAPGATSVQAAPAPVVPGVVPTVPTRTMYEPPSLTGREALYDALNSERDIQELYTKILVELGQVAPFGWVAIAKDLRELDLTSLLIGYGLALPAKHWDDSRIDVPNSLREACLAAVEREEELIAQYDAALEVVRDEDIHQTFLRLRNESEGVHLKAFEACVDATIDRGEP